MVLSFLKRPSTALLVGMLLRNAAWGCAVCMGAEGADLTRGMNMGILSLLGIVLAVLAGFGVFFIYLVRRHQQPLV